MKAWKDIKLTGLSVWCAVCDKPIAETEIDCIPFALLERDSLCIDCTITHKRENPTCDHSFHSISIPLPKLHITHKRENPTCDHSSHAIST